MGLVTGGDWSLSAWKILGGGFGGKLLTEFLWWGVSDWVGSFFGGFCRPGSFNLRKSSPFLVFRSNGGWVAYPHARLDECKPCVKYSE